MSFEEVIKTIIREVAEEPGLEIEMDSRLLDELGFDSFSMLMIVNALEDKYQTTIDESILAEIKTVQDIVDRYQQMFPNERND